MSAPSVSGLGRVWHRLSPIIGLALFVAAVAVLGRELRHMPPGEAGICAEAVSARRHRPGDGLHGAQLPHPHRLRPARVPLHPPADTHVGRSRWRRSWATPSRTTSASRCSRARRPATASTRAGASAARTSRASCIFYSGTFWLGLLVLGGWTLARGPALRARDVRPDVARAVDRLGAADDGARVPRGGGLQAAAAEHRRHADHDAVARPRHGPVRAVRPRLGLAAAVLYSLLPIRGLTSSCSSARSSPRSSSRWSATCLAASACSSR